MASGFRATCPAPRAVLACEHCRSKRARCSPSRQNGTCQRCLIGRKECIFNARQLSSINRKTKTPESLDNNTVQDSGDVIATLLEAQNEAESEDTLSAWSNMHARAIDSMFAMNLNSTSPSAPTLAGTSTTSRRRSKDASPPARLSPQQAKLYLDEFMQHRASHFPFLSLPPLGQPLSSRPFLSLAILCLMASSVPELSKRLKREFLRVLGEVATGGARTLRRSLDILQGLCAYLAWYPLHLEPRSGCVNRLIRMAVELLEEVKADELVRGSDEWFEYVSCAMGCYVLDSCVATRRRPKKLAVSFDMIATAAKLATKPRSDDDIAMIVIFRLQVISDEMLQIIGLNSLSNHVSGLITEPMMEAFQERVLLINDLVTPKILLNPAVMLTRHLLDINLTCMRMSSQCPMTSTPSPIKQCLQATEASMRAFLSTDKADYSNYTTINWVRLIHTVITAFNLLCAIRTYPNIPSQTIEDILRFDAHFELLRQRMKENSDTDCDDPQSTPDYFFLWSMILEIAGDKYRDFALETKQSLAAGTPDGEIFQVNTALCPIISGSLQQTAYWDALSSSGADVWPDTNVDLDSSLSASNADFECLLNSEDWSLDDVGWEKFMAGGEFAKTVQPEAG